MRLLPVLALFVATQVWADPVAELKTTLGRLQGEAPLKGQVSVRSETRSNEGKEDAETRQAAAQIGFDDGPQGLRLQYSSSLLAKAAQEELARRQNGKAPTPTASGLSELDYKDVRGMTNAAEPLARLLSNASFKGERQEQWQGQPARVLSFSLPQTDPNKYVKEFSATLDVFVGPGGLPLGARSVQKASGRAFVAFSFEMTAEDEWHYAVSGERLLATRRTSKSSGSGAGEKGTTHKTFALQPG